jgi:hypothetical protein
MLLEALKVVASLLPVYFQLVRARGVYADIGSLGRFRNWNKTLAKKFVEQLEGVRRD